MIDVNVKETQEKVFREWEAFKADNDRRLKEIESKGRADPLLEEKVNKMSVGLGEVEKALKALETKANRPAIQGGEQDAAKVEHKAAFGRFLRKGDEAGLAELQTKAFSIGTAADGGYLVPQDFDRNLAAQELKWAPMRELATVITVASEKYERQVNVHGGVAGWVAETGARANNTTPQFFNFKPVFGELFSNWAAAQRLLDDSAIDLEAHIVDECGRQMAITENAEFTAGAGVAGTSPKGFLAYTPSATPTFGTNIGLVKSGTAGTIVADPLMDVPAKLLAGYRNGAVWTMAALTLAALRKLKDTTNQYLVGPLTAGTPQTLLGFPIVENEDMPAIAASANAIAFGNFKRGYVIADVVGTRLLRDPYSNKPNVNFYITKRVGGGVLDTSAIVAYQLAL